MIDIRSKELCCGCSACRQACPKQCIKMEYDLEGFLYPVVDRLACVGCNQCIKVCPMKNVEKKNESVIAAYAAFAIDEEVRIKSSSGGLFTCFAEEILNSGGIVFGAAFDEKQEVHHILIKSRDSLELVRGSKYIQSRIENTYKEAEEALSEGKKVLFTGTACQISGLKSYLGRDYPELYTVDVLCHGAAPVKLWKRYLTEQEKKYGAAVVNICFRQKDLGWKKYSVELCFDNKCSYQQSYKEDSFMQMFLSNICLRPSCHNCKFKSLNRDSDITIGDAWGIDKFMPEMDDDKGTSVVIVHSTKGRLLLRKIQDAVVIKEGEIEKLLPFTSDSRRQVKPHRNRERLFKDLEEGGDWNEMLLLLSPTYIDKIKKILKIKCPGFYAFVSTKYIRKDKFDAT